MALDFLKKAFFKRNKEAVKDEPKAVEVIDETSEPEKQPVKVEITQEEKENVIKERFAIPENSPLKLLWNVYNDKSEVEFNPYEYVLKPIIETNTKLNELSESEEYISFDENQEEFFVYIKRLQGAAIKFLKQIFSESVDDSVDSFLKGINIAEFENNLSEYSEYSSYDEFKYACDGKRKEAGKMPFDSQPVMYTSKDKLHTWITLIPPLNGGSEFDEEAMKKFLSENSVTSGINDGLIAAICQKKKYLQVFEIARGTEAVHGKDGVVADRFERQNTINIREDENGNLNYKELNNVKSIHADDVICDITYPTEGIDGMRVDGKVIAARQGRNPKIPQGRNTVLSEDKSMLISEKDGELVFKDGVFLVNELLTIEHDVDNASGNIDFSGDVLIKGDVREGFSVKAEGNITIKGTAEGATIVSASSVIIEHGMTGGGKGVIRASQDIRCKFLENCYASSKGNIYVDQVMYSELSSGGSIYVEGKKGSVTGGKLIAGKSIKANVIGAANNTCLKTEVVLGFTPQMIKRQQNINHSLKGVSDKLFKTNQDINYIESNIDKMPKDRIVKLEQLKVQAKFMTLQKETLEKNLEELNIQMEETAKACDLKCKTLNPIVNLTVGDNLHIVNKPLQECHLYMKENVAVLSSLSLAENIEF